MPKRPLTSQSLSPGTIAIFEALRGGEWVTRTTVLDLAAPTAAAHEPDACLRNGTRLKSRRIQAGATFTDADLITVGSRDIVGNRLMIAVRSGRAEQKPGQPVYRLTEETSKTWETLRTECDPALLRIPSDAHDVKVQASDQGDDTSRVDSAVEVHAAQFPDLLGSHPEHTSHECTGLDDATGWERAPLREFGRVHFKSRYATVDMDSLRAALPHDVKITHDPVEDLYRVDCALGASDDIRDSIRAWATKTNFEISALRAEKRTRARELADLDPVWLSGLYEFAQIAASRVTSKHRSTLRDYHQVDQDEVDSMAAIWIVRAICTYDAERAVPFGPFLSQKIQQAIYDLNRKTYGRGASDTEQALNRATHAFTEREGRDPSTAELAVELGITADELHTMRTKVRDIQQARFAVSLDPHDGDSDSTQNGLEIAGGESAEARLDMADARAQLTRALLAATAVDPDAHVRSNMSTQPNLIGFLALYDSCYAGGTKKNLAERLGVSMRVVGQYEKRAQERLQDMTRRTGS